METENSLNNQQEKINKELIEACKNGDLDKVRYVLTSPELSVHADIHASVSEESDDNDLITHLAEEPLFQAAKNGHLSIVKYLLTSSELKEHSNINIDSRPDSPLLTACHHNHLPIVKYLLTSPELVEHANINHGSDNALCRAVRFERIKIIKYLLTAVELKNKVTISDDRKTHFHVKLHYTKKKDGSKSFIEFNDWFNQSAFIASLYKGNIKIIKFLLNHEELKDTATLINQTSIEGNVHNVFENLLDRDSVFFNERRYSKALDLCKFLVYEYGNNNKEYQDFLLSNKIIRSTLNMHRLNDKFPSKLSSKEKKVKI